MKIRLQHWWREQQKVKLLFNHSIKESSFIDDATTLELSDKDEIRTVDPVLGYAS